MLKGVIESLLFITNRPLTKKELANLVEEKVEDVEKALEELVAEYAKNDKGIKMVQNGKEFQMVTDPANSKVVQKFLEAEVNKELTPASLETLSIIAYRAPISREELEQIRGINCAIILRHLLIKGLIGNKFHVHSVARKGQISKIVKIAQAFQDKGILFILQLERDYTKNNIQNPFVNNTKQEKEIIKKFGGRFYNKNILKFKGCLCWSGSKYFVIDERGDAYRCNPAQRLRDEKGYLGNLLEGTFKLRNRPTICRYGYCYCVQPIREGLILGRK